MESESPATDYDPSSGVFCWLFVASLVFHSEHDFVSAKEFTGARYCSWMGRRFVRDREGG